MCIVPYKKSYMLLISSIKCAISIILSKLHKKQAGQQAGHAIFFESGYKGEGAIYAAQTVCAAAGEKYR